MMEKSISHLRLPVNVSRNVWYAMIKQEITITIRVSAFIKSMRGSDPDAAVYYLARMLYAGEDIKFIARRIMICAAEDVSNADPMALVVATSAAQAVERIGMPEAQIILSQAVTYVASAPKSNSAVNAIFRCDGSSKEYENSADPGTFTGCTLQVIRKTGAWCWI